jgi:hypothetical protein
VVRDRPAAKSPQLAATKWVDPFVGLTTQADSQPEPEDSELGQRPSKETTKPATNAQSTAKSLAKAKLTKTSASDSSKGKPATTVWVDPFVD